MQLKDKLGLAVGSLLLSSLNAQAASNTIESGLMLYQENNAQGNSMDIWAPVVSFTREISPEETYSAQVVFDSLSGASPNGAAPSTQAQTFSSASGSRQFTTPANEKPFDPMFEDHRLAISLGTLQPLAQGVRAQMGIDLSTEYDYTSLGVNGSLLLDDNNKATTWTLGGGLTQDWISPQGGYHQSPLITIPQNNSTEKASYDRITLDLLLGVTQIINRNNLLQINLGLSYGDGYQIDPYKLISVINGQGDTVGYVGEKRPDTRLRKTLYGQWNSHWDHSSTQLSYRYYTDDWGIDGHTTELQWIVPFRGGWKITPLVRHSVQTKADFFVPYLSEGFDQSVASADTRLGDLTTDTVGAKLDIPITKQWMATLRYTQSKQNGTSTYANAPGGLNQLNFFPELTIETWFVTVKTDW